VRLDELDLLLLIVEALVVHVAHALVAGQEHCAVGGWRTSGAGQLCIRRVRRFDCIGICWELCNGQRYDQIQGSHGWSCVCVCFVRFL
jgi:hypothetical protein